ncbi:hypothetical protein [Brytella acorum]|uniref:Uncharacterized protein n=1 Tax=Brytella acorum TaxID=2959299 RepID=A0AA35VAV2_9PROT|nr:hypothetical protein [Brytella acorum]MDF3623984.1 hypothetical protein [Brytella acorum]CAI9120913.1 hypothetical protein LMG32879_001753 [Brytella acorum]
MAYDSIQDDLAFMRSMAEAGQRVPLSAGPYLVFGGIVFGGTSLLCYALFAAGMGGNTLLWMWIASLIVFGAGFPLVHRAAKTQPQSRANDTLGMVWTAIGWVIFACFLAALASQYFYGAADAWALFPSLVLALYGAGWVVTARVSRIMWLNSVAVGGFAMAVLIVPFERHAFLFVIYGLAILLLSALPGWQLMREARRDGSRGHGAHCG